MFNIITLCYLPYSFNVSVSILLGSEPVLRRNRIHGRNKLVFISMTTEAGLWNVTSSFIHARVCMCVFSLNVKCYWVIVERPYFNALFGKQGQQ